MSDVSARSFITSPTSSTPCVMPSALQVAHRRLGRAEEQLGQVVCHHAVDLLRHGAIVGAQAGLDVRHRHAELGGGQRPGQCGVGVAVDEDQAGVVLAEHSLDAGEAARRLLGVRAGPDAQRDVRLGQRQLLEEHAGQTVVVVLAGIDQHLTHALAQASRETTAHFTYCGRLPTTVTTVGTAMSAAILSEESVELPGSP